MENEINNGMDRKYKPFDIGTGYLNDVIRTINGLNLQLEYAIIKDGSKHHILISGKEESIKNLEKEIENKEWYKGAEGNNRLNITGEKKQ